MVAGCHNVKRDCFHWQELVRIAEEKDQRAPEHSNKSNKETRAVKNYH